jgi:hypothetical protein
MGRIVILDTGYQTVSAVQDFFEIKAASTQTFLVHRAKIMQSSDEAASEAELLQVNIKRAAGSFTSGSGGGTATVVKNNSGDASHGLTTIERNNTTQAVVGSGTLEVLEPGVFNVIAGEWEFAQIPELRFVLGPSEAVIFSLDEVPSDALTLRAIMVIEIIAG